MVMNKINDLHHPEDSKKLLTLADYDVSEFKKPAWQSQIMSRFFWALNIRTNRKGPSQVLQIPPD